MQFLHKNKNTFLRIEGTYHNGTEFWVEYENFEIQDTRSDSTKYQLAPAQQVQLNRQQQYPITSMTQVSSSSPSHRFILIRPNYLEKESSKERDRELGSVKQIQDRFYAGFSAQVNHGHRK